MISNSYSTHPVPDGGLGLLPGSLWQGTDTPTLKLDAPLCSHMTQESLGKYVLFSWAVIQLLLDDSVKKVSEVLAVTNTICTARTCHWEGTHKRHS